VAQQPVSSLIKQTPASGPDVSALWFASDEWVPNNRRLPVLLYRGAIASTGSDPAAPFEQTFAHNGWPPAWRNGVYPYHHYHSTAHEVLGFARGAARLLLGGPHGQEVEVNPGDCVLLPAGTGHCRLDSSQDFLVVGAYPPSQDWDLLRGPITEPARERMEKLAFPLSDPIFGLAGPMMHLWSMPSGT
jgi:uncharacterized protein YjlB